MTKTAEKAIFTVSQLNRRAKQLLETHLPLVWISGEISNLAMPGSGHWYLSLKDDKAQVRCAMFRNANQRLRWQPKNGDQVLIRARVSLYEGRGEYQLIAEHMEAAGAGIMQQSYEALKAKLQQEGLFDDTHKQILPSFPRHIGVITSPTGAAIHDILSVLKRRYPIASISVLPVSVQGENAVPDMLTALQNAQYFNTQNKQPIDVLIIGRGGGSIEDLWAFNNEQLARAMAACPIPIVSAVGHEVDFTIADFVADERAPTPSVSAEIITPDLSEWLQTFDYYYERLQSAYASQLQKQQQRINFLSKRLRHPGEKIQAQIKQISFLQQTLILTMQQRLEKQKLRANKNNDRLLQQHPKNLIMQRQQQIQQLQTTLERSMNVTLKTQRQRLIAQVDILNVLNPLAILGRGYAVVSHDKSKHKDRQKNGAIIKNSHDLKVGDKISIQFSQGSVISHVEECLHKAK